MVVLVFNKEICPCKEKPLHKRFHKIVLGPYLTKKIKTFEPGEEIQIGPYWDLSKAQNNGYNLLLVRIEGYPRTFWGSTYENTPFGFCGFNHKVENKTKN